jgi:general secretion pathway protein I
MLVVDDKRPDLCKGGFTLLEVMIALLIIATSFVVLLHTRNQSVITADYAKRATVATLLASERMSDIEQEDFPDTGDDSSNFGDDYPEYRWKTSVSDTAYENIREVKVEVLWGEGTSERSMGLVNYVRKKD